MMSNWSELNFRANPFSHVPLEPTLEERKLLIARDSEVRELIDRLADDTLCICIEGLNGVGKTSLAQAVVFDATSRDTMPFVGLGDVLQPLGTDSEGFVSGALDSVAGAAIASSTSLPSDISPDSLPNIASLTAAYDRAGAGLTVQMKRRLVHEALSDLQAIGHLGGIVGIIDNLEVISDLSRAVSLVEFARDPLFTLPLTRWLIVGTPGVVRALGGSPRLQGYLASPVAVAELDPSDVADVVVRRYEAFALPGAIHPVEPETFQWLYATLGADLRSSLSAVVEFVATVGAPTISQAEVPERRAILENWLRDAGQRIVGLHASEVTDAGWELVDMLGIAANTLGPLGSEWSAAGDQMQGLAVLQTLEGCGLIAQVFDPERPNEILVRLSKSGYLAYLFRRGSEG